MKEYSQLKESSNDFIIGNDNNANTVEVETTEPHIGSLMSIVRKPTVGEHYASHDQDIEENIADRIKREVDTAATAVRNRVCDAILTARTI